MAQSNNAVLFVGRLLMAAVFLPSGIGKALDLAPFARYLASQGLPYPEILAMAAAAAEIAGGILLVVGVLPTWTAVALLAFVAIATGIGHRYWEIAEAAARRGQEISFYKNLGLAAGLLFYAAAGPGAWSLSGLIARKPAAEPAPAAAPAPAPEPAAAPAPQAT